MKPLLAFLALLVLSADVEACGHGRLRGRLFGRLRHRHATACCTIESYTHYESSVCGSAEFLPPVHRSPYAAPYHEPPKEKVERIPEPPR